MNPTLLRAVILLIPVSMLVGWSAFLWWAAKAFGSALQLVGAACLALVVLTHVAEALDIAPGMKWGDAHSTGHYLDLSSAVLGVIFVPVGYAIRVRQGRRSS